MKQIKSVVQSRAPRWKLKPNSGASGAISSFLSGDQVVTAAAAECKPRYAELTDGDDLGVITAGPDDVALLSSEQ